MDSHHATLVKMEIRDLRRRLERLERLIFPARVEVSGWPGRGTTGGELPASTCVTYGAYEDPL